MNKMYKTAKIVLCILLVLAFFTVVALPHAHSCNDTDCAICSGMEKLKELSGTALLLCAFGTLFYISLFYSVFLEKQNRNLSFTLIRLKVKLSD